METEKELKENNKKVFGVGIKQRFIVDMGNAEFKDINDYIDFLQKKSDGSEGMYSEKAYNILKNQLERANVKLDEQQRAVDDAFEFINSDATRRAAYEQYIAIKAKNEADPVLGVDN
jgi:hypothetical protein